MVTAISTAQSRHPDRELRPVYEICKLALLTGGRRSLKLEKGQLGRSAAIDRRLALERSIVKARRARRRYSLLNAIAR